MCFTLGRFCLIDLGQFTTRYLFSRIKDGEIPYRPYVRARVTLTLPYTAKPVSVPKILYGQERHPTHVFMSKYLRLILKPGSAG
jgi:hypothetical protein